MWASNSFSLGSAGTYNLNGGGRPDRARYPEQWRHFQPWRGDPRGKGAVFSTSQALTLTGSGGNGTINIGGYSVTLTGLLSGSGGLNVMGRACCS